MSMKPTYLIMSVAVVASWLAGTVVAADDLPAGVTKLTPAELKWKPSSRAPGLEIAEINGDGSKPGPYIYRVKYPPNFVIHAHSHPDDRTYTIISGTWYVGYGNQFDPAKMTGLPAGSFYTEPAGVNHFVVVKEEGAIVQITGTGPTGNKWVDPAKTSGPTR